MKKLEDLSIYQLEIIKMREKYKNYEIAELINEELKLKDEEKVSKKVISNWIRRDHKPKKIIMNFLENRYLERIFKKVATKCNEIDFQQDFLKP